MSEYDESPKSVIRPVKCIFCGRVFDYTFYPQIVIPGDNKLKKKLLKKDLYYPTCPYCNEIFKLRPGCVYRNEIKREMFVVIDSPDDKLEEMLKTGNISLNDLQTEDDVLDFMKSLFKRRIVRDVDCFREKILLSEYNYDDRIIELMKLALSGLVEKDNGEPVYRIFLDESSGNYMEFVAIIGASAPYDYVTVKTPANVYTKFRNKYLDKLKAPEDDEYIFTDQNWAKASGLLEEEDLGFIVPI